MGAILLFFFFTHVQFLTSHRARRPFGALIAFGQPAIERSVTGGSKGIDTAIDPVPGWIFSKAAFLFFPAVFKSADLCFLVLCARVPACTLEHGAIFAGHG
jgi:hypothetical protein